MSNDGQQLIVGEQNKRQFHIYTIDGTRVTSISLPGNNTLLYDAAWTRRGDDIVCTSHTTNTVTVMSKLGQIKSTYQLVHPMRLNRGVDDTLLTTEWGAGISNSADDGKSWSNLLKPSDANCWEAIKVRTDIYTDDVWSLETNLYDVRNCRLRKYTLDRRNGTILTQRDLTVPNTIARIYNASRAIELGRLVLGPFDNVFTSDYVNRAVHVWSSDEEYDSQLLSEVELNAEVPDRMAVSRNSSDDHVLYLGLRDGIVNVYALTYTCT